MIKLTVLYGQPTEPTSFEKYYSETHLPIAAKVQGISKLELTKMLPNPDGSAGAYYRTADLYFANPEEMQKTLQSAEGKAMADDLANFATGGVTILFGAIEK
ncbi:MAG: EthD family reductase [Ferruginibacter sp.]